MKRFAALCLAAVLLFITMLSGCGVKAPQLVVYTNMILPDMELLLETCPEAAGAKIEVFSTPYALERALQQGGKPDIIVQQGIENAHYLLEGGYAAQHGLQIAGGSVGCAGTTWVAIGGVPYVVLYDKTAVAIPPQSYFDLGAYSHTGMALVDPLTRPYYHAGQMLYMGEEAFSLLWQEIVQGTLVLCESEEAAARKVADGECALAITTYVQARKQCEKNTALDYCLLDQQPGTAGTLSSGYVCMLGQGSGNVQQAKAVLQHLVSPQTEQLMVHEGICPYALRGNAADVPVMVPLQAAPEDVEQAKNRCGEIILDLMQK